MRLIGLWAIALLLLACDKNSEPSPRKNEPSPLVPATGAASTAASADVGVTWKAPAVFEPVPPTSKLRLAGYRIAPADGDKEPGDIGVFYFGPGKGGSIDDNVKRWVTQFKGGESSQKRNDRTVNGLVQHLVEAEGTYNSGMPGGPTAPKPTWALIGAIIETPSGNHFFKLVGPKATVEKVRKPFMELLDSVKPK
jgi:hypothetical protein